MEPEQQPTPIEQVDNLKDQDKPKTWWITTKKKVSSLKFHKKNPRVIDEKRLGAMKESISEFGFVDPIVVNLNNVIISGHRRVAALLDWEQGEEEVDVRMPNRLLSPEEHEKLMLVSNKLGERGWDWDKLNNEFDEALLEEVGFTELNLGGSPEEPVEEAEPKVKKQKFKEVELECPNCHEKHTYTVEI